MADRLFTSAQCETPMDSWDPLVAAPVQPDFDVLT
jgi:hypothetical protein